MLRCVISHGGGMKGWAKDVRQQFASDNYAGACPEALRAMVKANDDHAPAYGDDEWTALAADTIRDLFETNCEVFFTFNGTAANSLALAATCQSYNSVICTDVAHIHSDECGAPEFFSNGSKILAVPNIEGKLTGDLICKVARSRSDIHFPKPAAVSITQATETGQVYSCTELQDVAESCRTLGLRLHMDGARFANACASLECSPADLTWRSGVDVLCLGGTKNGMAVGEAVVFFDTALAENFAYRCKQAGQLASKMRFLAAPWVDMIQSGAWLRNAAHANACARRVAGAVRGRAGIELMFPVEANAVFLELDDRIHEGLKGRGWKYYTFIGGGARFMFAWDAKFESVDRLCADLIELSAEVAPSRLVAAI